MNVQLINLQSQLTKPAHASDGARVGDLLYVSGQIALDEEGAVLFHGDVARQTTYALEQIEKIAQTQGGGLGSVASVSVFLTDIEDFAAYNRAYAEKFGSHAPARTTVRAELAIPGLLVEISAVLALQGESLS